MASSSCRGTGRATLCEDTRLCTTPVWIPARIRFVTDVLAGRTNSCTRAGARRLGLVTLGQMQRALLGAVEDPVPAVRLVEVPEIRGFHAGFTAPQAA